MCTEEFDFFKALQQIASGCKIRLRRCEDEIIHSDSNDDDDDDDDDYELDLTAKDCVSQEHNLHAGECKIFKTTLHETTPFLCHESSTSKKAQRCPLEAINQTSLPLKSVFPGLDQAPTVVQEKPPSPSKQPHYQRLEDESRNRRSIIHSVKQSVELSSTQRSSTADVQNPQPVPLEGTFDVEGTGITIQWCRAQPKPRIRLRKPLDLLPPSMCRHECTIPSEIMLRNISYLLTPSTNMRSFSWHTPTQVPSSKINPVLPIQGVTLARVPIKRLPKIIKEQTNKASTNNRVLTNTVHINDLSNVKDLNSKITSTVSSNSNENEVENPTTAKSQAAMTQQEAKTSDISVGMLASVKDLNTKIIKAPIINTPLENPTTTESQVAVIQEKAKTSKISVKDIINSIVNESQPKDPADEFHPKICSTNTIQKKSKLLIKYIPPRKRPVDSSLSNSNEPKKMRRENHPLNTWSKAIDLLHALTDGCKSEKVNKLKSDIVAECMHELCVEKVLYEIVQKAIHHCDNNLLGNLKELILQIMDKSVAATFKINNLTAKVEALFQMYSGFPHKNTLPNSPIQFPSSYTSTPEKPVQTFTIPANTKSLEIQKYTSYFKANMERRQQLVQQQYPNKKVLTPPGISQPFNYQLYPSQYQQQQSHQRQLPQLQPPPSYESQQAYTVGQKPVCKLQKIPFTHQLQQLQQQQQIQYQQQQQIHQQQQQKMQHQQIQQQQIPHLQMRQQLVQQQQVQKQPMQQQHMQWQPMLQQQPMQQKQMQQQQQVQQQPMLQQQQQMQQQPLQQIQQQPIQQMQMQQQQYPLYNMQRTKQLQYPALQQQPYSSIHNVQDLLHQQQPQQQQQQSQMPYLQYTRQLVAQPAQQQLYQERQQSYPQQPFLSQMARSMCSEKASEQEVSRFDNSPPIANTAPPSFPPLSVLMASVSQNFTENSQQVFVGLSYHGTKSTTSQPIGAKCSLQQTQDVNFKVGYNNLHSLSDESPCSEILEQLLKPNQDDNNNNNNNNNNINNDNDTMNAYLYNGADLPDILNNVSRS